MLQPYEIRFAGVQAGVPPRAGILPVPYDRTACYQPGTRSGPDAILRASANMECFDEVLGFDPSQLGVATFEPLVPRADGPRAMLDDIRDATSEILAAGLLPIVLGGDHSITNGALEAVLPAFPNAWVLHLDAHADMRASWEGSPWSHACIMRRTRERCRALSVGIRSFSEEEAPHIADLGDDVLTARACRSLGLSPEKILSRLGDEVYVTLDVDVLDPSIMPATGTPEPGGFLWDEIDPLLAWLGDHRRIVGFDIVELMPIPGFVAPDFLASRLTYRLMGRALAGRAAAHGRKASGSRAR